MGDKEATQHNRGYVGQRNHQGNGRIKQGIQPVHAPVNLDGPIHLLVKVRDIVIFLSQRLNHLDSTDALLRLVIETGEGSL